MTVMLDSVFYIMQTTKATLSCNFNSKAALATIVLSAALCGCTQQPSPSPNTDSADKAAAEERLHDLVAQREAREARQRQLQEQRAAAEAARQAEADKPRYPAAVLQSAAKPRTWGPSTIEGMGIDGHLNSTWTDGHLNYRIALLAGERRALEQFMMHKEFHINFQDQPGNNTFEYVISPSDFVWASAGSNGGIPTMETRGQVNCDLNAYMPAVQWNLTWVD